MKQAMDGNFGPAQFATSKPIIYIEENKDPKGLNNVALGSVTFKSHHENPFNTRKGLTATRKSHIPSESSPLIAS